MEKKNIYKEARETYLDENNRKLSQSEAGNRLNKSRGTIAKWEDNLRKDIPTPEEVILMSQIYNNPALKKKYCNQQCPIGKRAFDIEEGAKTLFHTGYGLIKANQDLSNLKDVLFDILEDGVVDEKETETLIKLKPTLNSVQKLLAEIEEAMSEHIKRAEENNS